MKTKLKLLFLIMFSWNSLVMAAKYVVTSTNPDSLNQAIIKANSNAGADTIEFNISKSDPNFNAASGVWTIQPVNMEFNLNSDGTVIDGASQTVNQGDTNPQGPEIEIDGTQGNGNCFVINNSSANKIRGLIINRFPFWGIVIEGNFAQGNVVIGSYLGTDFQGNVALGNAYGGIYIGSGSSNTRIGGTRGEDGNIISGACEKGNISQGNGVTIEYSDNNMIYGNFIGTNRGGTSVVGNLKAGIVIYHGSDNIIGGQETGKGNVISGNGWCGICIRLSESRNNTVVGNYIGTDTTRLINLGNGTLYNKWNGGVILDYGAQNNFIGPGNAIAFNSEVGVRVLHDSTTSNTISQNSITHHSEFGIFLEDGGNSAIVPPVINEVTSNYVSGTTTPNCVVEIFSDSTDEAAIYEGTVNSDDSGNFTWVGKASGPHITATVTDAAGNTSQFSEPYTTKIDYNMNTKIPKNFYLSQNHPNPFNPVTIIDFYIPKPGKASIKIYDIQGKEVITLVDNFFNIGKYSTSWDGKNALGNIVASGIYFYSLESNNFKQYKKALFLK